ncbi:ParB/RepB/Spo0J family partition protein [Aliarcobacter butzleri]|uniref:ParB/RepB/Spo0J family partition protein n=1 Tax=Aliarcobacter butzleri TaxID=28197 RepID=UPI002B249615|nr:ParB N-terminal domain-containing protein [Aliarcobacter butzleri]
MAKVKPQRITSINNTIDELKAEQEIVLKNYTNIELINIDSISELKLDNNILMHNRISYSKSKLLELAENISKLSKEGAGILGTGLLNPVMLRKKDGRLERIHGENRIRALILNGNTKVPAIVLENISDELARFMRSSENLNRENLNTYDETLSILEHIQLACSFNDIDSVKSFLNKVKNFQAGKSSLNEEEKILHKNVSDVFEKIGRFDIITFVDRLSVLKLDPLIKQALVDEQISYSQAKVIKSKLKNQSDIVKILDVLKNKKLSVNELKVYIDNLKKSSLKEEPIHKNVYDLVNFYSKKLSRKVYSSLSKEDKFYIDSKLKTIEALYLEINSKIKE